MNDRQSKMKLLFWFGPVNMFLFGLFSSHLHIVVCGLFLLIGVPSTIAFLFVSANTFKEDMSKRKRR